MTADGLANTAIARRLDVHADVVSRWRKRFAEGGLPGWPTASVPASRARSPTGGRAGEGAGVRAARSERDAAGEVELPGTGPRDRGPGITASISASTVRRWLAQNVLKPWQHRSRIFPRDPYFAVKAALVFDLYERIWEARPLAAMSMCSVPMRNPACRPGAFIRPCRLGPAARCGWENECARCGTLAYLAAYDVHRGQVMGRCEPATGIKPFAVSVQRVFWVVDDGASHRGWTAAARMSDAWPNVVMVYLPVHASRLNQRSAFRSSSASCWSLTISLICPPSQRRSASSSAGTTAQPSSPGSAAP
jgi:hypothetical protein